jgi:hypothetical protein
MDWARILAYVTGMVDQELLARIEYLAAENRILKSRSKGRLQLSDAERAALGEIGHRLGRKALAEVANVARPDTILAWYRNLGFCLASPSSTQREEASMLLLRHGHAPGHVRDMFLDAIEAYRAWQPGEPEPKVEFEVRYQPRLISISQACRLLWNRTDHPSGSRSGRSSTRWVATTAADLCRCSAFMISINLLMKEALEAWNARILSIVEPPPANVVSLASRA